MTILSELSSDDEQVVDFTLSDDRTNIEVRESCDNYFFKDLNKKQFGALIKELQDLHDEMIDDIKKGEL